MRRVIPLVSALSLLAACSGSSSSGTSTAQSGGSEVSAVFTEAPVTTDKVAEAAPRRKGLIIVAVLAVLGIIALVLWRRSSSGSTQLSVVDAGPGAPVDIAVTTSA